MVVQLGMLADGGLENNALLRFVDHENVNTAKLRARCTTFLHRICMLFVDGGCRSVGITKCAFDVIRTPLAFRSAGRVYQLGGKDADTMRAITDTCQARMAGWARVASAVLV